MSDYFDVGEISSAPLQRPLLPPGKQQLVLTGFDLIDADNEEKVHFKLSVQVATGELAGASFTDRWYCSKTLKPGRKEAVWKGTSTKLRTLAATQVGEAQSGAFFNGCATLADVEARFRSRFIETGFRFVNNLEVEKGTDREPGNPSAGKYRDKNKLGFFEYTTNGATQVKAKEEEE